MAGLSRRRLLELLGVGSVSAIAGCSQGDGSASPSPPPETPTQSQPSTQSPTSTPQPPSQPVWKPREPPEAVPASEVVGAAHADGTYNFTEEDFLNEGAARLSELGTDVIKLWLHDPAEKYSYNSEYDPWYDSMVEVAQTQPYREVFGRSFSTYVLLAQAYPSPKNPAFHGGLTEDERRSVSDRFEALARHLLETYDGTGKTFVLQHWEGTLLANKGAGTEPLSDSQITALRRWLSARQAGVRRARDTVESDVTVLHASEVVLVLDAMQSDAPRFINEVIPETDIDLVSYTAYELSGQLAGGEWAPGHNGDAQLDEADTLIPETLDYIESNAPAPNDYVAGELTDHQSNVYIGEFSAPLQVHGQSDGMELNRAILEHSLDWGVRWALYWQVYDNEKVVSGTVEDNDDVRGHYLVRPDGTNSAMWTYLSGVVDRGTQYWKE